MAWCASSPTQRGASQSRPPPAVIPHFGPGKTVQEFDDVLFEDGEEPRAQCLVLLSPTWRTSSL